ncbi:MAG: hypothetical protein F4Z75_03460 [Synechococcus sp. SB0668_bin_15]|nr:hypothetical protein [Synechococcus sp. SB0668_bin_15]MXZ83539.1 hypothetical protein [Synechococcus sp. SB0666_bin_14]MYA91001.1 hypothetical protein [Synechococcus sp. SB0663_bin_10]MYC49337.1 hypothetical protein [Synechococcus sp. SB0662_bin_14]MYG47351.1 hypothetical protein [Synechococcus sp. SB0675_bin_6]
MIQKQVIAQVKPRLQQCLEQKDRPGILALTKWVVHRHGHPLLQQLLSQPEWASHRLWWGKQISHQNPGLQPRRQSHPETTPAAKDHRDEKTEHKTLAAAQATSDPWETTPAPQQHPEPGDGLRPDKHSSRPAKPTTSSDQDRDDVKLMPAQVIKQRLMRMGRPVKPAANSLPVEKKAGKEPTVTQAVNGEQPQKSTASGQHRSLRLRDWLPRSRLPHQDAA